MDNETTPYTDPAHDVARDVCTPRERRLLRLSAARGLDWCTPALAHLEVTVDPAADAHSRYVDPDFATLFDDGFQHRVFAAATGGDPGRVNPFTPAAAMLCYAGAELYFDELRLRAGFDAYTATLDLRPTASLRATTLEGSLPDFVVDLLDAHPGREVAAWVAFFLAEIQLHAVQLAAGRFLTPHTPASAVAFHGIVDRAVEYLCEMYLDEPTERRRFESLGGHRGYALVLETLRATLVDPYVAPDSAVPSGPRSGVFESWFTPRDRSRNPWLGPLVTR